MKGTRQNLEEAIRVEAYLLSEKAGHPAHLETTFWMQAEAIVHGRVAVVAPTGPVTVPKAKVPAAAKTAQPKAALKAQQAVPVAVTAPLPLVIEAPAPARKLKAAKPKAAAKAPNRAAKK